MAYFVHRGDDSLPKLAASAINAFAPVFSSASSGDEVITCSNALTHEPIGFAIATAASPGEPVAVMYEGVTKAKCAASVGVGANVGVASTNGALGPSTASAGAWKVGISQKAALPGETFSVLIKILKVGS